MIISKYLEIILTHLVVSTARTVSTTAMLLLDAIDLVVEVIVVTLMCPHLSGRDSSTVDLA
jgi:drug/metabolite transporter superfamily protein YnfA